MKRRIFLKKCTSSIALTGSALAVTQSTIFAQPKSSINSRAITEDAYNYFIPGKKSCCESILMSGCKALNIHNKIIQDIALGFSGGIGLQGQTCGVLTGASMVMALAIAQKETEYSAKKQKTLKVTGRIYKKFKKKFSSCDCKKLIGLDLTTPEGKKALKNGVKQKVCVKFVEETAKFLAVELQTI